MTNDRRHFGKLALGLAGSILAGTRVDAASPGVQQRGGEAAPTNKTTLDTIDRFLKAYWAMKPEETANLATEDFVWVNMPMPAMKLEGRSALLKLMKFGNGGFPEPIEAGECVFVYALADGSSALHERIDRMKVRGKWIEIPCNAHWEVHDGKVRLWRDYYDLKTYLDGMASVGIKIDPSHVP